MKTLRNDVNAISTLSELIEKYNAKKIPGALKAWWKPYHKETFDQCSYGTKLSLIYEFILPEFDVHGYGPSIKARKYADMLLNGEATGRHDLLNEDND